MWLADQEAGGSHFSHTQKAEKQNRGIEPCYQTTEGQSPVTEVHLATLLWVPELPKTVPPAGDQVWQHVSLGGGAET